MTQVTAQAMVRGVEERLKLTLAEATFVDSLDVDGFPILKITKSLENHFLKIVTIEASGHKNSLGMDQVVYSPHKCILVQEESASALAVEARIKILAQAAKLGMKLEVYEGAGVATEETFADAIAVAVKVAEVKSHEIHGMTISA